MAVKNILKQHSDIAESAAIDDQKVESRALAKGLFLLEELAKLRRPATLAELAGAAGLGKASTFRLLQTLIATGYATQDQAQNYVLNRGWVPSMTQDWLRRLVEIARPEMQLLSQEFAETVSVAALLEDHIRVVEVFESPHNIRLSNYKDRILAPNASSLGKAISAYQNPERVQKLLQVYGIYQTTEKTLTDPAQIRQDLGRIRERGYSVEYEETVRGGCCFGAPIFSEGGEVVLAAMSLSLPTARLTPQLERRMPEALREATTRVSARMSE